LDLRSTGKTRAFSLIGLNESGKTTILEAIYSFSPDPDSQVLFSESDLLEAKSKDDLIPRGEISDFTGTISVQATVSFDDDDKASLKKFAKSELALELDAESLPSEFKIISTNKYEKSKHSGSPTTWAIDFNVKAARQRKFRVTKLDEWRALIGHLKPKLPKISYFPTSVFSFPSKIYLSGRDDDKKNNFYKKIFQDVLDYQGESLNIKDHIVDRVHSTEFLLPWVKFFAEFYNSGEKRKIDQVIDKASSAISDVIFSKWNEIFKEDAKNKEIIVEWGTEDSGSDGASGHKVYITFHIKDGANRFEIADRSLGFRWFFCFLLFTQFRAHRIGGGGTLFLFDEPASNLHAKAQEKLLESFPKICEAPNGLIYSTHSHYLIEPRWLEHAYIIENRGIEYEKDTISQDGNDTDIKAIPYRRFVSENPRKTSYFQPILDKLDVKPSRFDLKDKSVLVEGKSDFYIISYFFRKLNKKDIQIIPGTGASTLDSLISLLRGWNFQFFVLLDGDKEGVKEKKKYTEKFSLSEDELGTLFEVTGKEKEIEDLLGDAELKQICSAYSISTSCGPSKKQILAFFQELNHADPGFRVSTATKKKFTTLFAKFSEAFD